MRLLDCWVTGASRAPTVTVRGEVDFYTVDELRACLEAAVASAPEQIVIDLSELDYIDSAGLGVLVSTLRRLRQMGADLVLQAPSAGTYRLLEIAGLADRFKIVPPDVPDDRE